MFIAGDDEGAKGEVADLLRDIGWKRILDLGDVTAAAAWR